jgi:putative ABC transport system ATP-binding protein
MTTGDALVMRDVSRVLHDPTSIAGGRSAVTILRDIHLGVGRGALLQVVGPSGSGKTSLIRLINRLDDCTAGTIDVLGRRIDDWPPGLLRRRVGMVFQRPTLLGRSVRDNLRLPILLRGQQPDENERAIEEAIDLAGCERSWMERDASQLSAGQQQRVSLARSLVAGPDILLLDEPTGALDPPAADRLLDRLGELRRTRSMTIILTTHRIDEARRLGGAMVVLIDGRIAASGSVATLLDDPPDGPAGAFLTRRSTDA